MKKLFFILFAILIENLAFSQSVQTIRGTIKDIESKSELIGAGVYVMQDSIKVGATQSDADGNFRIENIPTGRYDIRIVYIGYQQQFLHNIIVSSGKEVVLNIEMAEMAEKIKEATITATKKNEVQNEMATVSARTFSVEEANRYAGSMGDPARMASSYAGVQKADDSRNDIVIRGNSPMGLLWRMEDIDIPNPNHFAVEGTTGGDVSILNTKMLSNSDFMTGAFPAEYGNCIAGVFDLKMRNGNNEHYENTAQVGLLGAELTSEGPITKGGASYLVNYRYSTLSAFEALHINIGTNAIPRYQDVSFKINIPMGKKSNLSFWGMGGTSGINIIVSKDTAPSEDIYGYPDRDQYFTSSMGITGVSYTKTLNDKAYIKLVIAESAWKVTEHDIKVYRNESYQIDSMLPKLGYRYIEGKTSAHLFINKKFNSKLTLKAGVMAERYQFNMIDSIYNEEIYKFENRTDYKGEAYLFQPYVEFKYKFTNTFWLNGGIHGQDFTLNNNSKAIEPRAGLKWQFAPKQGIAFGYGMHSQMLPTYIYLSHEPSADASSYYLQNKDLGFYHSTHYVLSYDNSLSENLFLKVEAYYQYLNDIPVNVYSSSFSLLNQGASFDRFFPDTLSNKGTGRNYGLELTLEKYFSHSWFFMITSSLYDAKYRGSDGLLRNADFNGRYSASFLFGKSFEIKKNKEIEVGIDVATDGGRWYSPIDTAKTRLNGGEEVYVDSMRNKLHLKDYFRTDVKIDFRINAKKLSHEIGIDLVNVFNTQNVLAIFYDYDPRYPNANPVKTEYELGFLPVFYYKVDF